MEGLLLPSLPLPLSTSSTDDLAAIFSFHKNEASTPPNRRKTVDNSNGPVGPRLVAAKLANCPAIIATIESPA